MTMRGLKPSHDCSWNWQVFIENNVQRWKVTSIAFQQKFHGEPSLVDGFDNLFAMEVDPPFSFPRFWSTRYRPLASEIKVRKGRLIQCHYEYQQVKSVKSPTDGLTGSNGADMEQTWSQKLSKHVIEMGGGALRAGPASCVIPATFF